MNLLGADGEDRAARFLEGLGCRILERSFRAKVGEIDLIVEDGDTLVFVEVKARTKDGYGGPEASVTYGKKRRIAKTAAFYLMTKRKRPKAIRFDVVAILDEGITHLKDAFPSPIRFTL